MKLEAVTTETLLTHPELFALTTASPVQRAFCRAIDGLPLGAELACDPDVVTAFGGAEALAMLPNTPPVEVDLLSAIRSGKSLIASVALFRATQKVDVSALGRGDIPRVTLLSLRTDLAQAVYDHLLGGVLGSPILRRLVIEEPTADAIVIRHPAGRKIEIKIAAGAAAGSATISRWSAGVVIDEAPRFAAADDGKIVNYDETRRYALGRLLPGAQFISIGSPWAPRGPIYDRAIASHGKPSRDLLVVRATGPQMNPMWWTPERCEDLRRRDPIAFETDVCANFADPESAFITTTELRRAVISPTADEPKFRFFSFAMDPGTRGNSWPLVVVGQYFAADGTPRFRVVRAVQWTGSPQKPLSPVWVLGEIKKICAPFGMTSVSTDQHSGDALHDIARRLGFSLCIRPIGPTNRNALFETIKSLLETEALELPDDRVLLDDLASVRRRLTPTGVTYHLPKSSNGRHADFVPALGLALVAFGNYAEQAVQRAQQASIGRRVEAARAAMIDHGYSEGDPRGAALWRELQSNPGLVDPPRNHFEQRMREQPARLFLPIP